MRPMSRDDGDAARQAYDRDQRPMRWIGTNPQEDATARQPGMRVMLLANQPPSWRLSDVPLPWPHLLAIAASAWLSRMRP